MDIKYYNREGIEIPSTVWIELMRDNDYRLLARDGEVSTVWLGIDHNFFDSHGESLTFETLVLSGPLEGKMERYSTEEQAMAGHAEMVKKVEAGDAEE